MHRSQHSIGQLTTTSLPPFNPKKEDNMITGINWVGKGSIHALLARAYVALSLGVASAELHAQSGQL